ncbi:MucR family transcriptional regulator, partial [Methylobacterium sp. CCH5-D2]
MDEQHSDHIGLAVEIVAAYVANNSIPPGDLQGLITSVHGALVGLSRRADGDAPAVEKLTPAQIRKSITNDNLISFEDGKPYKTLRRHLTLR